MFKEYVKPILVLTAICLVLSMALGFVYNATEPVVTQAAAERAFDVMYSILPEAEGFTAAELALSEDLSKVVSEVYLTDNDIGMVVIASSYGYSGEIRIICAVGNDGRIIETRTLSHTETVGIGTVIEDETFLSKFINRDKNLEDVDTVTGATISTSAFIRAVNGVFEVYELVANSK